MFDTIEETDLGLSYQVSNHLVFFGKKPGSQEELAKKFSKFEFLRVDQVHGTHAVKASHPPVQADAHWTDEYNFGLCIVTADCLPIMVISRKKVAAIHAGWRGLFGNIIGKTLRILDDKNAKIIIGPHIQRESFEVGLDVATQLQGAYLEVDGLAQLGEMRYRHSDPVKTYVDLSRLAKAQCLDFGIDNDNIFTCSEDTFADTRFCSFRRDGELAGRQISFVVRLKQ